MFVAMLPMAFVGAYLNRHDTLVYPPYAASARARHLGLLTTRQQAGAIMWVGGSCIMAAGRALCRDGGWWLEERRQAGAGVTRVARRAGDGTDTAAWRLACSPATLAHPAAARVPAAFCERRWRSCLATLAIVGPGREPSAATGLRRRRRRHPSRGTAAARGRSADPPTQVARAPGPGEPDQAIPTSPALSSEGRTLFQEACSSCHGTQPGRTPGIAPSLRGVGAGPVEFYLTTGRMPLEQPRDEPLRAPPPFTPRADRGARGVHQPPTAARRADRRTRPQGDLALRAFTSSR